MAELFDVDVRTISEHLQNIFKSQELNEDSVVRVFRITAENEMLQIARVHADTKISVEVIDVAGKTVAKNICQGECEFSLRSLATGIYVAKVMFNNKVISKKIVK